MDIAVTGSHGMIGEALCRSLVADGHRVVRVVRHEPGPDEIGWDPNGERISAGAFDGIDAVVHLAGRSIGARRWSAAEKARIEGSRRRGTALVARAIADSTSPPAVLISASGINYYGDRGDQELTEEDGPGEGFLTDVCVEWEAATAPAAEAGARVAHIRTAVVLAAHDGALRRQLPLFRFGLGGRLGDGSQYFSWITLPDHVRAIRWLLEHEVAGPVNLSAPGPVRNTVFTEALGAVLRRPTLLPIPKFAPRLLLGRALADELLFASMRVVPTRLQAGGFEFQHQAIEPALRSVLGRD